MDRSENAIAPIAADTEVDEVRVRRFDPRQLPVLVLGLVPSGDGAQHALEFAAQTLREGGDLLVKVFQGEGYEALVKQMRKRFGSVSVRKPKASRPRSREVYLLARNHRA